MQAQVEFPVFLTECRDKIRAIRTEREQQKREEQIFSREAVVDYITKEKLREVLGCRQ